ncbi:hypothetical protein ABZ446_05740 [Streptomyces sp. NPDC005813]|uniref:anti-sigma factor family protein n=1 Tax=Streptomyces sp. NPDC005813 TaxID=3155592 RepID=UPI0033F8437C
MTSTTDTAGHPDVAEISDLTEGLLSPSRTEDVRRHLETCAVCSEVYESLEEIRGLLGTMPGPARMPDDVAGRIDAALAAEALLSATAPDQAARAQDEHVDVSRETSTEPSTTDAPLTPLGAGAPASAGDSGSPAPTDRPSGHPRAATGPGRAHRARRGRRRAVVLGTVFTAAALGLGTILVQSMGGDGSGKEPQTRAQQETTSKVTFSEGQLEQRVSDLLSKNKSTGTKSGSAKPWGAESQGTGTGSGGVDTLITPKVPVPDCVQQGTGNAGAVLGAEKGTYKGTSVYLVVQPDVSDGTKVTAYIVDDACEKKGSGTPGKLLLTKSYDRS